MGQTLCQCVIELAALRLLYKYLQVFYMKLQYRYYFFFNVSPLYKDLNAVAAIDLSIDVSYLIQRDRVFS